MTAYISSQEI